MRFVLAAVAAMAFAGVARADVVRQDDTSFQIRNVVQVGASPQRAYAALGEIGRWWSDAHTYSGSARNMTLSLQPGACFCESLPGGGVAHGRVVLAWPGQGTVRIEAALGPLQEEGVSGALTFQIRQKGQGAEVVQTYAVGGGRPGFAKAYAAAVDQVLREQLAGYARYVGGGRVE